MKSLLTWLKHPLHLAVTLGALLPMYMVALYMHTYAYNVPMNDHWLFGIKIATAAQNGTLSLEVILQDFAGHRIFFTGALHALMARLTDWNTVYEMYVNLPLAVGEFILSLLILRKAYPHLVPVMMIPFSLLIFAVYQYWNWLSGFYTIWHFVPLFFLLSVLVLQQMKPNGRAVALAILFAICATFSLGPGVVVWVTVLISMVLFGYRQAHLYAAVLIVFAVTIFLYTREVQVSVAGEGQEGGFSSIRFAPIDEMATFFFSFLGNPFTAEYDHIIASRLAGLGMALFLGNLAYLYWNDRNLKPLAPFLIWAAFALGVAILITITRYVEFRWITALEQRYTAISTYFWLAYFVTGGAVVGLIHQKNIYRWQTLLLLANIALVLLLGSSYLRANLWNWQATAQRFNGEKIARPFDEFDPEDCLLQYPLTRDGTCVWETFVNQLGNAHAEQIYQVAAYRMTIFATQEAVNVLPSTYQDGDPIVIQSPTPWLNVYIRDWMLAGISDAHLYHIAPPEEVVFTDELPRPLGEQVARDFAAFDLENNAQIWVISTSEVAADNQVLDEKLSTQGYIPLFIPIRQAPYAEGDFKIVRYRRAPEDTETLFRFGGEMSLQAVQIEGEFEPCAELQIESWWLAEQTPSSNYSATLVLQDSKGEKRAHTDGSPAGIETGVWVTDLLYPDDRSLTLPCDLPAGEYEILWGLYDAFTVEDLPVFEADGNAIGTRAPIQTFTIE